MLIGPRRSRNCFGLSGVESGHSLVPDPPDKTTGVMRGGCVMTYVSWHRAGDKRPAVFGKIDIRKPRADSTFAGLDQFVADGD